MDEAITVRRIRADEWQKQRDLRLRALAEAPLAFGSTLAREQALPEETWRERASGGAADADRATFIAERGGTWAGMATGLLEPGGDGERPAWVVGMWVDPGVRRRGVARSLLTVVADWARERGADVLNLDVTETNIPAIALYESLGFRASGATEPLPHTPALRENHMSCPLARFGG
ncbi:MAG TPA: GNAT family N-acetyltransferase [Dehalococcoidia bacterium]|jgi:GNAT superfamily N-acetyltransferase|nr:GNAT family N-acetyltransferase [Dehalococcoidia bacterium]